MITNAEEDMAICVSNRFTEVVNVAKSILETLEQPDNNGSENNSTEKIVSVRYAERAIIDLTGDMYHCGQGVKNVMTDQSVDATKTFERCTSLQI